MPSDLLPRFSGMDEDELVQEFADFFADENKRVAPKTLWSWVPGIRAWLLENGVRGVDRVGREISCEFRRKVGKPKTLLNRDTIDKEDILKILKVAEKRDRAIVSVFASSGLRLSACLGLQLKNLKDDIWDPNLKCYQLEIFGDLLKGGDRAEPHFTFISPEAAEYVRELLLDRTGEGEQIGPESFLFVAHRGGGPLSPKRFSNIWRDLCREAQVDMRPVTIKGLQPQAKKGGGVKLVENGVRFNVRVHSLRKFFKTACSMSGVDRMASESFLGHTLTQFGIESIYDYATANQDWLRQEYLKVLNTVTMLKPAPVLEAVNGKARGKIEHLEKESEDMREKVESLEQKVSELTSMLKLIYDRPEVAVKRKR